MIGRFGQINKLSYVMVAADITATATLTQYVNLSNAHRCTFLIPFGAFTGASITAGPCITVLATSAATTAGETNIGFNYRKSGAVATDTWGAVTAVAASDSGLTLATADGSKLLLIDIDPMDVRNGPTNLNGEWVHLVITPQATETSACPVAVIAEIEPRYIQTSPVSAS